MNSYRKIIGFAILVTLSISVFSQRIEKIDRSKQHTEKSKSSGSTKGTTTPSSKKQQTTTKAQSSQTKKQSQTAQSTKSKTSNNGTHQQTSKRTEAPYLRISTNTASFDEYGGSRSFQIQSNNSWDIKAKTASWGQLERNGNTLTLRVSPNTSAQSRTDFFTISSSGIEQKVSISQSGNPNFAPYLNVSKTTLAFVSGGGRETITISSNREWRIKTSTYSWGHIQRNGNTLIVSVDSNDLPYQRTDFIDLITDDYTVECRINITQNAANNTYSSTPSSTSTYPLYSSGYHSSYTLDSKRKWWKENFKVGIDADFETNINGESGADMFYSVGLMLRLGNFQKMFSITTGVKYRWLRVMSDYGEEYYTNKVEWLLYGGDICIPLNVRFKLGYSPVFLGVGGELGMNVYSSAGTQSAMNQTYFSIIPQIGLIFRHYEMACYWKCYPNSPFRAFLSKHNNEYRCNSMIGISMSVYF